MVVGCVWGVVAPAGLHCGLALQSNIPLWGGRLHRLFGGATALSDDIGVVLAVYLCG